MRRSSRWTHLPTTAAPAVRANWASSSNELSLVQRLLSRPFISTATRYARSMGSAVAWPVVAMLSALLDRMHFPLPVYRKKGGLAAAQVFRDI